MRNNIVLFTSLGSGHRGGIKNGIFWNTKDQSLIYINFQWGDNFMVIGDLKSASNGGMLLNEGKGTALNEGGGQQ